MNTFYLVRHGVHSLVDRVLCGRSDEIALAPEGCEQARRLSSQFAGKPIELVQSSPRRRTRETAALIAERLGLPVKCADALDELDVGAWTGRRFEDLEDDPAWRAWNTHRGATRPPGGESMVQLQKRMVGHIEAMRAESRNAIIVTHAEPIRAVVLHYRKMPLDHFHEIAIAPGSVSVLRDSRSGVEATEINLPVVP